MTYKSYADVFSPTRVLLRNRNKKQEISPFLPRKAWIKRSNNRNGVASVRSRGFLPESIGRPGRGFRSVRHRWASRPGLLRHQFIRYSLSLPLSLTLTRVILISVYPFSRSVIQSLFQFRFFCSSDLDCSCINILLY